MTPLTVLIDTLEGFRITPGKHFWVCLWGCSQTELTEQGRPALKLGNNFQPVTHQKEAQGDHMCQATWFLSGQASLCLLLPHSTVLDSNFSGFPNVKSNQKISKECPDFQCLIWTVEVSSLMN